MVLFIVNFGYIDGWFLTIEGIEFNSKVVLGSLIYGINGTSTLPMLRHVSKILTVKS
jgi:hypothetical protein